MCIKKVSQLSATILAVIWQSLSAQFPAQHIFSVAYNGQTVRMTDSTYSNETCDCYGLEIWAVNFTLDGAENKLRGTPGGNHDFIGLGIRPESVPSNVTVKNLEVTTWGHGIYGVHWSNGLLDSCYVHHNERGGYQSGPTDGNNTAIEISNSTFDSNDLNGIKISDASYYYVHHNTINNNGYQFHITNPQIEPGGLEILRDGSHHNRIEHNTFTDNDHYGIKIHTWYDPDNIPTGMPKHNLIKYNTFDNNMVWVEESDSNTFIGNEFLGTSSKIRVINCIGNVFIDCAFPGLWNALNLEMEDAEVTFIGTSFEGANVTITGAGSALTVGWHVDATVTDNETPVAGAVVQFYDKDNVLVATDTTNAEGKTDTLDLMAYIQGESSTTYVTPYRFVVLRDDAEFYSSTFDLTDNTHLTTTTTAVEDREADLLPVQFALEQNRPNPFNPQTTIEYTLDRSQDISLTVYTIGGRQVRVLEAGYRQEGSHQVVWDGMDNDGTPVTSGVYIYRLLGERGDQLLRKAVFLK